MVGTEGCGTEKMGCLSWTRPPHGRERVTCVDNAARTLVAGVATDKADRGMSCLLRSLAETEGAVC